jgi:heptosyltransferase-2
MTGQRILIVRVAGLGDVAITSVLLNRVRVEAPGSHITWLCSDQAEPLVRLFPGVDEVISVPERALFGSVFQRSATLSGLWKRLLGRRVDRVLLVHADTRYLALVAPLMARGTRVDRLHHRGEKAISLSRYRGDEFARLWDDGPLKGPVVRRYELADIRARLPEAANHLRSGATRVVLAPGGARNVLRDDALRRWPAESFRELAARLAGDGIDVALVGDDNDALLAPQFVGIPVTNYMGKLSLIETLQVLHGTAAAVACDSGPLHLARLVRAPVVGLFGPTIPRHVLGPESPDVRAIWGGEELACRPCYDGRTYAPCSNNLCMRSIPTRDVYAAVRELALRAMISSTPAS